MALPASWAPKRNARVTTVDLVRGRMGRSYVESPLEVLWWVDDMNDFIAGDREKSRPVGMWDEDRRAPVQRGTDSRSDRTRSGSQR